MITEQRKLKAITSKVATLLIASSIFISCDKVQVKNYFIPKNFTGNVAVIYSKNSASCNEINNFKIPESGILKSNCRFEEGNFVINFYQGNSSDGYDTLFEELAGKKIDTTKNRIYFNRVLTFYDKENKEIFVSTFYIGKAKASDLGRDRFLFERKIENIALEKELLE